jgi:hypothetical protein
MSPTAWLASPAEFFAVLLRLCAIFIHSDGFKSRLLRVAQKFFIYICAYAMLYMLYNINNINIVIIIIYFICLALRFYLFLLYSFLLYSTVFSVKDLFILRVSSSGI